MHMPSATQNRTPMGVYQFSITQMVCRDDQTTQSIMQNRRMGKVTLALLRRPIKLLVRLRLRLSARLGLLLCGLAVLSAIANISHAQTGTTMLPRDAFHLEQTVSTSLGTFSLLAWLRVPESPFFKDNVPLTRREPKRWTTSAGTVKIEATEDGAWLALRDVATRSEVTVPALGFSPKIAGNYTLTGQIDFSTKTQWGVVKRRGRDIIIIAKRTAEANQTVQIAEQKELHSISLKPGEDLILTIWPDVGSGSSRARLKLFGITLIP